VSNYCQYCGLEVIDGRRKYCCPECREADYADRGATCETCGRKFLRPRKVPKRNVCEKCWYKEHGRTYKKYKAPEAPKPKFTISDAIREQERIARETGRHVSYGEIMARRRT